jgi:peptidoglycan/LPS O-acetylase OafA/YrhL
VARHSNNMNVLRLLFAGAVIFSHSYPLAGAPEPTVFGRTVGSVAVHGFFVISGYLIAQSFERSRSLGQYSANRVLRIGPGLVVAMFFATLVARVCHSFPNNPVPYISNGPVWTLTWEVACYIAVAVLGILGVLRAGYGAFFCAVWVLYLSLQGSTSDFYLAIVPMLLMFAAGTYFAKESPRFPRAVLAIAGAGLLLAFNFQVFATVLARTTSWIPFLYGPGVSVGTIHTIVYLVCFPVVLLWLATGARTLWSPKTDISYGVYLYGWPVAQLVVFVWIRQAWTLEPLPLLVLTLVGTVPLALASWFLVERPAMRLKSRVGRGRRDVVDEPAQTAPDDVVEPEQQPVGSPTS